MSEQSFNPNGQQDHDTLEQWIREAGNYVAPSRDLRPRVIELAKQSFLDRKQTRRASLMAMAVCAIWFSLQPLSNWTNQMRARFNGPTIQDFHARALEFASQPHESPEWGLAQAIIASRQFKPAKP